MSLMQQFCVKGAAFAAVIAVGTLSSGSAQAAIVKGTVTGTWNVDYGSGLNVTAGDTFQATYTYDDAALTPYSYSFPGNYDLFQWSASLLSLIVESGTFSHTFDFANGQSQIYFGNVNGNPDSAWFNYDYEYFGVYGEDYDATTNVYSGFSASKTLGTYFDGTPFKGSEASLINYDGNGYSNSTRISRNVEFTTDPTAVPAPALLPGLIGMGIAALRKRKAEAVEQANVA